MNNKPTNENINAISLEGSRPNGSGSEDHKASLMTNESSYSKLEGTTITDISTASTEGDLSGSIKTEGMVKETTTLKDMLERMCLLERGEVPVSAVPGAVLTTYSFPGDVLSNRFIGDKISHFYALHTDFEVSVKIAVAPTVTVSLAVVLHPTGTPVTGLPRTTYYPHVLLVGPDVKEGTITVPFFNEEEAYRIGGSNVWDVSLVLITPVISGTITTPVSFSAYGRMKSPRLMINVAESVLSVSAQINLVEAVENCCSTNRTFTGAMSSLRALGVNITRDDFLLSYVTRYYQNTPYQQGEIADQKGTISKVASTISSVSEALLPFVSAIPIIGEIAPVVPWIARAVEGTAGFFGFSRGVNMGTTQFVSPVAGNQLTQIDGIDNSVTLGLYQDNQIDITKFPLFSGGDEMCFDALFSRKFIRDVIILQGDYFKKIPLRWVNDSTSTNIMDSFSLRRYEIRNEFRLVKNAMISGKMLVLYDYNDSLSSVSQALQAVDSLTSKIVDVTTTSSFLFNIPWTSLSPFGESTPGSIVIVPFNEFQTSSGGSDSISLIRYVSYANVELGRPGNMLPFVIESQLPTAKAVICKPLFDQGKGVVQQGYSLPEDGNMHTIPSEELPMLKYTPTSMVDQCVGEMVVSTRSLLKRFTVAFSAPLVEHSTTIIVKEPLQLRDSLFHRLNSMWMARTGSLRMKVVVPPNMNLEVSLQDHHTKYTGSSGAPFQFFSGSMNSMAEFTVPYYGKNRRSFSEYPWAPVRLSFIKQYEMPGNQSTTVYVAAGDDYSGTFVKGKLISQEASPLTGFESDYIISPVGGKNLRWVDRLGVLSYEYVPASPDGGPDYYSAFWKDSGFSVLGNVSYESPMINLSGGSVVAYADNGATFRGEAPYFKVRSNSAQWVGRLPFPLGLDKRNFKSNLYMTMSPNEHIYPRLYQFSDPDYTTVWHVSCLGYLSSTAPVVLEFGRTSGGRGYPIYAIDGGFVRRSGAQLPDEASVFNDTVKVYLLIYDEVTSRWMKVNRDSTMEDAGYDSQPIEDWDIGGLFEPAVLRYNKWRPIFENQFKDNLSPY